MQFGGVSDHPVQAAEPFLPLSGLAGCGGFLPPGLMTADVPGPYSAAPPGLPVVPWRILHAQEGPMSPPGGRLLARGSLGCPARGLENMHPSDDASVAPGREAPRLGVHVPGRGSGPPSTSAPQPTAPLLGNASGVAPSEDPQLSMYMQMLMGGAPGEALTSDPGTAVGNRGSSVC